MSLKDTILAAQAPQKKLVTVPEWGGVEVELRGCRGATRAKLMDAIAALPSAESDEAAKLARGRVVIPLLPDLIIDGTFDPATGERVFGPGDREKVEDMAEGVKQFVGLAVLGLSGLGGETKDEAGNVTAPDAVDAAGKSSTGTPSDDSTSSSPSD